MYNWNKDNVKLATDSLTKLNLAGELSYEGAYSLSAVMLTAEGIIVVYEGNAHGIDTTVPFGYGVAPTPVTDIHYTMDILKPDPSNPIVTSDILANVYDEMDMDREEYNTYLEYQRDTTGVVWVSASKLK